MKGINNILSPKYGIAALTGIVLAVYFPILRNDFLYNWDDQWQVMNQFTEGGFNFKNLYAIFSDSFHGQYSPVNQLMYVLIYSVSGLFVCMVFYLGIQSNLRSREWKDTESIKKDLKELIKQRDDYN